ncbi:MAG TPA: HAD-IC family P-type ATPase [Polyangiaceae bacterium]
MKRRGFFQRVLEHAGKRQRRLWIGARRAHIEFRQMSTEELTVFVRAIQDSLGRMAWVRWVEVNPQTRRVIVEFEQGSYTETELVHHVARAEQRVGVASASFAEHLGDHPADREPAERLAVEIGIDAIGLCMATLLRLSLIPASRVSGSAASLLSIVRTTPSLRSGLDRRFGLDRTDFALSGFGSIAQGLAQRPLSCLVDLSHKAVLLREMRERGKLWVKYERELCQAPAGFDLVAALPGERPCPLPRGPIEEYADRAWVVALGGFAVSFLTTRSFQRAVAALFGGLPKPARLGRDVFAAELGRALSAREMLVLSAEALRRLDRVDCLVLDGSLVSRDRFRIGELLTDPTLTPQQARSLVQQLFDSERPLAVRRDEGWALGPLSLLRSETQQSFRERAAVWANNGALVVGLTRESSTVAVAEMQVVPRTGVEELIQAAHDADMRVVIASNDEAVLAGLPADDTVGEGPDMRRGILRLQREGRVVCVVATGGSLGLGVADFGIGLCRPGSPAPWGAHLMCQNELSDVRFIIDACRVARRSAKQSVNIALGAATAGALVSAGGLLPMTTRRVMTVVNVASLVAMANGVRTSSSLVQRALPRPRDPTPWHALEATGVLARLGSSEQGLTYAEVRERRPPKLAEPSALAEFASTVADEMFSPLAPLLAAGAGLSAVVGSLGDAGMVGGVMVLNAVVGGTQRFRAERAIRDLARSTRRRARTRRGGVLLDIDAEELVPGDVVLVATGDVVPADCRLIEGNGLEVDASSLTGESLPVRKAVTPSFEDDVPDRSSMLYEGTTIASGEATAVVVAVGEDTEARRGVGAKRTTTQSGVERRLRSLIDLTGPIAIGAAGALIGTGLLRGRRLEDLVGSAVSLAVASVPEGLPLLATAAQLAAADRLSQRGALVRNARSIEALGRVDVLCLDKTGTVTQGRIELSELSDGLEIEVAAEASGPRLKVLAAALRATPEGEPWSGFDPTDLALVRASERLALRRDYDSSGWQRAQELPFEAGRAYHAVVGRSDEGSRMSVKGAPEVILPYCTRWERKGQATSLDAELSAELHRAAVAFAERGLRVLAVAERFVGPDDRLDPGRLMGLTFRGFLALSDPVRPTAAAAIERLRAMGVRPVMLTGDHPSTAEAIAVELDMMASGRLLTGGELASLSDDELDAVIEHVAVFARVTPSQKVRVVRAFQRGGHTVAMAGDGANDAPAIRLANVGVAVGEQSTAAARSAADLVLTDERIETLVTAIAEGRAMWASVRDAVSILVGGNLGEVGFTVAAGLVDGRPPLNARQLLLVNLLTDVAPAMAIALRPPSEQRMQSVADEGPDASLGKLLTRDIMSRAAVTALGAGTAWVAARLTGSRGRASTVGLLALVGTQLGQTLASGGINRPVISTSLGSAAVLAVIVQTPGLSRLFGCQPIGPVGWATAVGASAFATTVGAKVPRKVEQWLKLLRLEEIEFARDPAALPARGK